MVAPSPQLLNAWRGDGGAAAMRAARAGMEIQNHWGSVDSHIELSVRPTGRERVCRWTGYCYTLSRLLYLAHGVRCAVPAPTVDRHCITRGCKACLADGRA